MTLSWANWTSGLIAGIVTAVGNAGTTYLGAMAWGTKLDWHALVAGCAFTSVASFFLYISTHPLPIVTVTTVTTTAQQPSGAVVETVVEKTVTSAPPVK